MKGVVVVPLKKLVINNVDCPHYFGHMVIDLDEMVTVFLRYYSEECKTFQISFKKKDVMYVWHLKDHNVSYNLKWSVVARGSDFNPATGICRVCLLEKFFIMFKPEGASLNQRSEFFTHCRHYAKFLLCPPPPRKRKRRNPPNRWEWKFTHIYTYLFIYLSLCFVDQKFVTFWYSCDSYMFMFFHCSSAFVLLKIVMFSDMKQAVQYMSSFSLV